MPRGNQIHARASRRVRDASRDPPGDIDHQLLVNGLHDDILDDEQLAHLEDAIARLEDLRDRRRTDETAAAPADPAADVVDAIEALQATVDDRLAEIVAERCWTTIADGDEWVVDGWRDADAVATAQREAAWWLERNRSACLRTFGEIPTAQDDEEPPEVRADGGEPPTVDPEREPEYVGAHSALAAPECQEWHDAEPDGERFVPTQCGREATHTVVVFHNGTLHEVAMCDECGEPGDVRADDRAWSGEVLDGDADDAEIVSDGGQHQCVRCGHGYDREEHDECPRCTNDTLDPITDGGVPQHLTPTNTIDGGTVYRCTRCGCEGERTVSHLDGCPAYDGDEDVPPLVTDGGVVQTDHVERARDLLAAARDRLDSLGGAEIVAIDERLAAADEELAAHQEGSE